MKKKNEEYHMFNATVTYTDNVDSPQTISGKAIFLYVSDKPAKTQIEIEEKTMQLNRMIEQRDRDAPDNMY